MTASGRSNYLPPGAITLLVLGLGAAGCARYEPHSLVPAQTALALDARSLQDPRLREFLEKNARPTSTNESPWNFENLYLAALYYHPSLDLARAQWRSALGGDAVAAGRPNPTVSLVPGYNISAVSPVTPWMPAITFDLPIETAGKRGYRMAQSHSLSESARFNIAATAWHVRSGLRTALIDFSAAARRENILQRQQALQEKILQSLQQRLQAGALSSSEITPGRIALGKIQLDLLDARQLRADARVRVADAIGISAAALASIDLRYDPSPEPLTRALTSPAARREALQSRSDLLSALAEYAASQSALQLEIAKQYPDIHLGPGYQFDQGEHKFTLSLNAELPILNQNQGPIAQARAKRTEAALRFIAQQARVITEIDRAVASYQVSRENLAALQTLATSQQKQVAIVSEQLQAGAAEQLDLWNAQIELTANELLQLAGETKLQQAAGSLEDAIQRPLPSADSLLVEHPARATDPHLKKP